MSIHFIPIKHYIILYLISFDYKELHLSKINYTVYKIEYGVVFKIWK